MCGICGIYSLDNRAKVDKIALERMRDSMAHRGPDYKGMYLSDKIGLGHCRLSIIDRSALAHQPISNEDGTVKVVLNGEIYNYLDLRRELEGNRHTFNSKSDTEVLVHLYEEYGESFMDRLRGMFALALWDEKKERLIIARDRVGQKPLVYATKDNLLYFASEIKALRNMPRIGNGISENSLLLYFVFRMPIGEETVFPDIKRLLPGKYMLIENGETRIKSYWSPAKFKKVDNNNRHPEKQLFSLLEDTVSSQMISDVPIGAFLSGGVDSSSIVGLMSLHSKSPIKTFSVIYEEGGLRDTDSLFAQKVSEIFKTEHAKIKFNLDWIEYLDEIVSSMDEPYSNPAALSFHFLCKRAKEDVTVVLSGDGGDEVFAGYSGYRNWKIINWISRGLGISGKLNINSSVIRKRILSDANIPGIIKKGLILLVSNQQKKGLRRMFDGKEISRIFTDRMKSCIEYGLENRFLEEAFVEFNKKDFIDGIQLVDLLLHNSHGITWMPDQIGMSHALEIRSPFLDHKLIEFAFSLLSSMRIKGIGKGKHILKKSLEGFLPKSILHRRKVGYGEGIPYSRFFRKEWNEYAKKRLFNGVLEELAGVDMQYLRGIYKENRENNKDHFELLWAVLILSIWLDKVYKMGV